MPNYNFVFVPISLIKGYMLFELLIGELQFFFYGCLVFTQYFFIFIDYNERFVLAWLYKVKSKFLKPTHSVVLIL